MPSNLNLDYYYGSEAEQYSSGKVYDLATDLHCANIIIL